MVFASHFYLYFSVTIICPHVKTLWFHVPWKPCCSLFFFPTIPTLVFICFLMQPEFHGLLLSPFPFQHHSITIEFFLYYAYLTKLNPQLRTCFSISQTAENWCGKSNEQGWLYNENWWTSILNGILFCLENILNLLTSTLHLSSAPPYSTMQFCLTFIDKSEDTNRSFSILPSPNLWSKFCLYPSFSSSLISQYPLSMKDHRFHLSFKVFLVLKCGSVTTSSNITWVAIWFGLEKWFISCLSQHNQHIFKLPRTMVGILQSKSTRMPPLRLSDFKTYNNKNRLKVITTYDCFFVF